MTLEQFETAVAKHRDRVYGFSVRFLGNRQEAEDVTQDVFIRLWTNRETVATDTLSAWILRVARNACVDHYRKRRTREGTRDGMIVVPEEIQANGMGADEAMDNKMIRDEILKQVQALREPYKTIVILREMQEMSYEEIGAALELPLTTVKVYLHRGRRSLRKSLEQMYGNLAGSSTGVNNQTAV